VIHQQAHGLPLLGLRFLPVLSRRIAEEREKSLWRFLLDAQRQQRRERAG
jgi:hypothetical protein